MRCEHRDFLTLGRCKNIAIAEISFNFARIFSSRYKKPYGNRMKDRLCCKKHLKVQKTNHHIMDLEINKLERGKQDEIHNRKTAGIN